MRLSLEYGTPGGPEGCAPSPQPIPSTRSRRRWTSVGRRALIASFLGAIAACSHAAGPETGFVQGDALVTLSVECLTLLVAGRTYQPVGLPDSLAVVGLRLRV